MSIYSELLGYTSEATYYKTLAQKAKQYWNQTFVNAETGKTLNHDGTINDSQGSYAIGLHFDMFDDSNKQRAFEHLAAATQETGYTRIDRPFRDWSAQPNAQ